MPISVDATPVPMSLISGREYVVAANGGSLLIETDQDGTDFEEGTVADGERYRLLLAGDDKEMVVTFTPSGADVKWHCVSVK